MSHLDDAIRCRAIADKERAKAEAQILPNARAVLMRSAEQWDILAAQAERAANGRAEVPNR